MKVAVFSVLAVLVFSLLLFWLFKEPVTKALYRKNAPRMFYRKLFPLVRNDDYYLVNSFKMTEGGKDYVFFDHIIGGDKYLFALIDRYYEGAVVGKLNDEMWVQYLKDGKRNVLNPLYESQCLISRLVLATGIDSSFIIGIVLVNDDSHISVDQGQDENSYLVPSSRLKKFIRSFEREDATARFDKDELWQTIQDLAKLRDRERTNS